MGDAEDMKQFIMEYNSPLGPVTLASDGENITGLWLEGQKYYASTLEDPIFGEKLPVFKLAENWLNRYFNDEKPGISLPLAPKGSDFRHKVWDILLKIPYGEVMTYGEIAKQLEKSFDGRRVSAQAVGGAVGHNPISIIIPCHRVVGTNGSLTGYAGGIDKKIELLKLEGVPMDNLFVPKKGTAL